MLFFICRDWSGKIKKAFYHYFNLHHRNKPPASAADRRFQDMTLYGRVFILKYYATKLEAERKAAVKRAAQVKKSPSYFILCLTIKK